MKKYKKTFTIESLNTICAAIEEAIRQDEESPGDVDTKLSLAVLAEVHLSIKKKTVEYRRNYSLSFRPAQAIAFVILQQHFPEVTTYTGNLLHNISNEVNQFYQL